MQNSEVATEEWQQAMLEILETYPHLQGLNSYALKVMMLIFQTYPSWAGLAEVDEYEGERFLKIKIPAPVEPTEYDLMITTEDDDLTIYFDWTHVHFGRFYKTPDEAFEQAKIFIDGLLNEDFIVAVKMVDGQWAGTRGCTPDTIQEIQPGEVSYTRSWRGTYNHRYE